MLCDVSVRSFAKQGKINKEEESQKSQNHVNLIKPGVISEQGRSSPMVRARVWTIGRVEVRLRAKS